ncbi:hypothetical protein SEA_ZOOMAN_254 [Microbacterium phage Zooman]|nr:hypothetical protein SEA_ZOOMAN_254 [Microbacterium phage Zooman]
MRVTTESGAVYEFTKDGEKVRRLRKRNDIDPEAVPREEVDQDGKWLQLHMKVEASVGLPMVLALKLEDSVTIRQSSVVVGIEE